MKRSALLFLGPLAFLLACGTGAGKPSATGGSGASDAGLAEGGAPADGGPTDAASDGMGQVDAAPVDGSVPTVAMPQVSFGAPAFASSSFDYQTVPTAANDDDPLTSWSPTTLPAWIAYDLSGVPASERQDILVVWNALHDGSYLSGMAAGRPRDRSPAGEPRPAQSPAPQSSPAGLALCA